jgi:hypothetical protein
VFQLAKEPAQLKENSNVTFADDSGYKVTEKESTSNISTDKYFEFQNSLQHFK